MDKKMNTVPCCSADALQRIRRVNVGGTMIGIPMLDRVFDEVASLELTDDASIREALLTRAKVYCFIPPSASDLYADALLEKFKSEMN